MAITESPDNTVTLRDNAYDYSFHTLAGHKPLPLNSFRGKVLLIVNTASKCGFTPQYVGLEKLYEQYKDKGLVILGVPSNDFGGQEPGSEEEITNFCQINYGVSFPMTSKEVVLGKTAHPFYLWAKKKLGFGSAPKWNFHKYLIDQNGKLITYFYSFTSPSSSRLIKSIEKALAEKP
ncbi:glutathione peroxidase [Legionella fallonii]|uniref:Glutathione peroxidase n=1 Tax=Legionella fallonii LLAP-10 TaxID=1212491 RepID=A0A098G0V8_9GAMM|nr:glutathione peroxidase [Legionella fallonii]CEG56098.1 Glutathione peroxidase [Legionella fallonii LLAP-10]